MRKVSAYLFITLDGVTEEPGDWQETFDDDAMADMRSRLTEADTILLGRKTYQYWEPYWPTATHEPFASFINNTPKYVVSKTLEDVIWGSWAKPTLLKGDLAEEITTLKKQPGKKISVEASSTLVNSLLQHDLLDELKLVIHNVIAGKGTRLFRNDSELKRLNLVESKTTRTGVIIATYQPRKA